MNASFGRLAVSLVLCPAALGVSPVPFTLDWISVDGGGGTALGADYALNLTLGQPDAGRAEGGAYVLHAGFWPGPFEVMTPTRPVLSAARFQAGLVLSWPATAGPVVLERTMLLGDPAAWQTVPAEPSPVGGELQVVLPRDAETAFFRLRFVGP